MLKNFKSCGIIPKKEKSMFIYRVLTVESPKHPQEILTGNYVNCSDLINGNLTFLVKKDCGLCINLKVADQVMKRLTEAYKETCVIEKIYVSSNALESLLMAERKGKEGQFYLYGSMLYDAHRINHEKNGYEFPSFLKDKGTLSVYQTSNETTQLPVTLHCDMVARKAIQKIENPVGWKVDKFSVFTSAEACLKEYAADRLGIQSFDEKQ